MLNSKSLKDVLGNLGMVAHSCNPSVWELKEEAILDYIMALWEAWASWVT